MTHTAKRVLLVGNFLSDHVGTRAVGEELAERLAGAGWTVTTTSRRLPRLLRLADMQYTIWRSDCAVAQVDVFSGRAFLWAELACWSLRRRRRPYVLTLHGGRLPELARRRPGRVRWLLASARAVTTPSAFLQEAMAPYRDDLVLLPNALDAAAYPFRLRERPGAVLVWLRAFHRVYNPQLAPRVLARLLEKRSEARLLMVGPDKGDGSLGRTRREAESLGVAGAVDFVGAVPKAEVASWLDRGDLFLNTADADNAPVSVLEALAAGLCVVSTDAGGIRHLLDDGENALVVARDDAGAMAAAAERFLDEPGLASRLSQSARSKAEAFDWSHVLPRWEKLLEENARP